MVESGVGPAFASPVKLVAKDKCAVVLFPRGRRRQIVLKPKVMSDFLA